MPGRRTRSIWGCTGAKPSPPWADSTAPSWRNQDYELNWRLRQAGHTVWFDPALVVGYRVRGTLAGLARQYMDYGAWKRVMLRKHPRALRWRQLAPPALVAGMAGAAVAGAVGGVLHATALAVGAGTLLLTLAAACPLGYVVLLAAGALVVGVRRRRPEAVLMPLALATMHAAWGIGFLVGWRARRR